MNARTSPALTVAQVQQRLYKIIDHRLGYLLAIEKKSKKNVLILNQAVLQEWVELLNTMVSFKEIKSLTSKASKASGHLSNVDSIQKISALPPRPNQQQQHKTMLDVKNNHVQVLQVTPKDTHSLRAGIRRSQLSFDHGLVHEFSSCTMIDKDNAILIGGCRESDRNLKSQDVMKLNIRTKQIVKIAQLPYGVSSHSAQTLGNIIYIVGGNKNFSVVTKKCLKVDLSTCQVEKIADLNYPSASHSLLPWKNTYIYKIGGIGSCFGQWDLSPYIERYDSVQDIWEIVNPNISFDQNLLHHYSLLVNSLSYVSDRGTIVVLGGFNFQQKGSRKMFQIQVEQLKGEQNQSECIHNLIRVGEVSSFIPGGFMAQQSLIIANGLYALEAIDDSKQGLSTRVVCLSSKVSYL